MCWELHVQCKVTCFIIAVDCSDFGYVCFALFENVVEGFSLIVCMKEIVESASTEMMDSIMLKYRLISPNSTAMSGMVISKHRITSNHPEHR